MTTPENLGSPETRAAIAAALAEVNARTENPEGGHSLLDVVEGATVVEIFDDVPCEDCDGGHPYTQITFHIAGWRRVVGEESAEVEVQSIRLAGGELATIVQAVNEATAVYRQEKARRN